MPRTRLPAALLRWPLAVALGLLSALTVARAQDNPTTGHPASSSAPAARAPTTEPGATDLARLTVEEVEFRLRLAQTSPILNESQKAAAVNLYSQAIQQLRLAERFTAVGARYDAARASAPDDLEAVQVELERPAPPELPEVSADATLTQLDEAAAQVETALERARLAESDLRASENRWLRRRLELPNLITAAKQRLTELVEATAAPPAEQQATGLEFAQRTLRQAQRIALDAERERFEKELLHCAAQGSLLQARLELARQRVAQLETVAQDATRRAQERRATEIEQARTEIHTAARQVDPSVQALANECLSLVQERGELNRAAQQAQERLRTSDAQLTRVRIESDAIEKRVAAAGLSGGIGARLQEARAALPAVAPYQRDLRQDKDRLGTVRQRMSQLEGRRAALAGVEQIVQRIRASAAAHSSAADSARVETEAREWVRRQQRQLEMLLAEYGAYFDRLVQADARERELIGEVQHVAEYVEASVLWLQGSPLPSLTDLPQAGEAITWLVSPRAAWTLVQSAGASLRDHVVLVPLGGLLAVLLIVLRPRLRAILVKSGAFISQPGKDAMRATGQALVTTMILAVTWPAILALAGWLVERSADATEYAQALGTGAMAAAVVFVTTSLVAQLVGPDGLGERHFRWRALTLQVVRDSLPSLTALLVPATFLIAALQAQSVVTRRDSLGRTVFVVSAVALAVLAYRLWRRAASGPSATSERHGWSALLRQLGLGLACAAPLALAGAAILGYYYAALYLSWKLLVSAWAVLGLLLLHALLRRWLLLRMQLRALRDAQGRAALAAKHAGGTPTVAGFGGEPGLELADIRVHTHRLVHTGTAVAAVVGFWLIWGNVLPALNAIRNVPLWTNDVELRQTVALPDGSTSVGNVVKAMPVTLADLALCLAILGLTVVAARNIPGLLEVVVLDRLPLASSGRYAVSTVVGYVAAIVGLVLAFQAIGVGWAKVQWLVAAMTVGLGFGLQEIFANFVSGLIILFERPIRVGDAVTVGDASGIVSRIRMRATTITDWDHKELIVPNKRFITGEVLNWTLTDSVIRLVLPASVAHGSNAAVVRDTLERLAREHPRVAAEPAPSAVFRGLGSSSMDFELSVFVRREDYGRVLHELNSAMEDALVAKGIGLAVPIQMQQIQVGATDQRAASL